MFWVYTFKIIKKTYFIICYIITKIVLKFNLIIFNMYYYAYTINSEYLKL